MINLSCSSFGACPDRPFSAKKSESSCLSIFLIIYKNEVMNKRILKSAIIVSMEEYDYFIGGFKGGLRA